MKGELIYSHCQFPVDLGGSHGRHSKPEDSLSFVSSTCVKLDLMSIASPQLWDWHSQWGKGSKDQAYDAKKLIKNNNIKNKKNSSPQLLFGLTGGINCFL